MNKVRYLLTMLVSIFLASPSLAATYNFYFSDDPNGNPTGNDSTGDGTISNPWRTLTRARSELNTLGSSDLVTLYFDRGDIWTYDSAQASTTIIYGLEIRSSDPIVHIDAYGTGNRPVFDGMVADFADAPDHNGTTGPLHYNTLFRFNRDGCSVSNIEIRRVYGRSVTLGAVDGFTLSHYYVHDFGTNGITSTLGGTNVEVRYSVFHTGEELYHYGKRSGWGAAIQLTSATIHTAGNHVHHNVVYDIYGEGIQCPNSLCEYNIVGDTSSTGLNGSNHAWDALTTTIRYNLITHSDWATSIYDNMSGSGPNGIRIYDEKSGGDNSGSDISIYGNVVINRSRGFRFYCYDGGDTSCGQPYGLMKIYNNTIIDSHTANFTIRNPAEIDEFHFYNNLSILYDRTGSVHVNTITPAPGWHIDNNAFWTEGGAPDVPTAYQSNQITSDPLLPGEPAVDWDGQDGPTYITDIGADDLYPPLASPLVGNGNPLGAGFDSSFLTIGTSWSSDPTASTWTMAAQEAAWDIGALNRDSGTSNTDPIVHYTMDTGDMAGGQVLDVSGNGHHATVYGSPQTAGGRLAEALHFDGFTDYLDSGYSERLDTWTVTVWVRGDSDPGSSLDTGPVMKKENFMISWDHSSSAFRGAAGLRTASGWHAATFGVLSADTWYHLAATYDGETLRAYRDGQPITANTSPSGPPDPAVDSMKIARHSVGSNFFAGDVDDVRVYDYALSQPEIESIYHETDADTLPPARPTGLMVVE